MTERTVLHLVRRYGELSQTFVAQVVQETDALGWRAAVMSRAAPANRALFPFPSADRIVHPARPSAASRAARRLAGHSPRERGVHWWSPAIRRLHPDLLHIHFGWIAADAAFERLSLPWLVSFHGSDVRLWPHQSTANRRAFDAMLHSLRFATASSCGVATQLRELGFAGRVEVIHPGVRLSDFPLREAPPTADEILLLYVGRQVAFKGLDVLLRAMPEIVGAEPRVRLIAIGDGELAADNVALAQRLGVADRVEFRGGQGPSEVARAMASCHVFVVPSRTTALGEAEGHPVAPKEALAVGIPIVGTDSGGVPDVMPPQFRTELAAEGDPGALARAVLRVATDPGSWAERTRVGREWVEQEFDSARLAKRLVALYEEVVISQVGAQHG